MNTTEVDGLVEEFLKRTRRALPPGPESAELLKDLRAHIYESLVEKTKLKPSVSQVALVNDVLEELGAPEDIAYEFKQTGGTEERSRVTKGRVLRVVARLLIAVIVVFLAAYFVSNMTAGSVDFWNAVIVLLVFAVAEWYLRAWQTRLRE